jgi:hypothetical protein
MSASQHSQLSIVPGASQHEQPEPADPGFEPTIGLKAVARILNCSAEQCRRLAEAKKIPVFRIGYRWKSTTSAIVRWREEQLALVRHSRPSEER